MHTARLRPGGLCVSRRCVGVCLGEECVCVQGDVCTRGGAPLVPRARHSQPPMNRQMPVKILPCLKLRLRAVISDVFLRHLNYLSFFGKD